MVVGEREATSSSGEEDEGWRRCQEGAITHQSTATVRAQPPTDRRPLTTFPQWEHHKKKTYAFEGTELRHARLCPALVVTILDRPRTRKAQPVHARRHPHSQPQRVSGPSSTTNRSVRSKTRTCALRGNEAANICGKHWNSRGSVIARSSRGARSTTCKYAT